MPGTLQCKTRLESDPKLRKDYTSFFYDQDYDYKYFFYMRELKRKIKRKEIKKYDDSDAESDVDSVLDSVLDSEVDLEYPDLLDNQRIPISTCTNAISFMIKIMTCLMAYNMYNNFESHIYASKMNGTIFSRI